MVEVSGRGRGGVVVRGGRQTDKHALQRMPYRGLSEEELRLKCSQVLLMCMLDGLVIVSGADFIQELRKLCLQHIHL